MYKHALFSPYHNLATLRTNPIKKSRPYEADELTVSPELAALYGTRKLITVLTTARKGALPCARWIQFKALYPTSVILIVPLSTNLRLRPPTCFSSLDFPAKSPEVYSHI